jgi:hypothetical protein
MLYRKPAKAAFLGTKDPRPSKVRLTNYGGLGIFVGGKNKAELVQQHACEQ